MRIIARGDWEPLKYFPGAIKKRLTPRKNFPSTAGSAPSMEVTAVSFPLSLTEVFLCFYCMLYALWKKAGTFVLGSLGHWEPQVDLIVTQGIR